MKNLNITINFDMDGTIADLYGVENWLDHLINENTHPYEVAKPMLHFATLARKLNTLKKNGYDGFVTVEFEGMEDGKIGSESGMAAARYILENS